MILTLIITIGGLAIFGTVVGGRALTATTWRETLTAYRYYIPRLSGSGSPRRR
jgi:hypothetical protein